MADDINEKEDGFSGRKEDDSEPVGNPAPPLDVDLDLLRGDRIGDTVYSGKWCIQTVMKMMQSDVTVKPEDEDQPEIEDGKTQVVDMEEELQNEVGVLWDMTSNVEVCQYLQSVGAIESIYHVIANSRCPRATEMCVGMLANIITHEELWQSLQSDTTLLQNLVENPFRFQAYLSSEFGVENVDEWMDPLSNAILIPLFSSTDQPVLLELSRFFTTAMSHSEMGHCYANMFSNGALVTQELVRILSGSTNCDLLKQTTELTHILMAVDKDDSHFNALFADPDFIAAVLEASKEIGYQQETISQSCIMEILHGFTTYPAGISAMETCMGAITEAISKYLRSLCHNINLSNSGDVITIIITLLNHIFCRSLEVRIELMSSSKLLKDLIKVLFALYRRLGLYDSVAKVALDDHRYNPPCGHADQNRHRRHHQRHTKPQKTHKKQPSVDELDDAKATSSTALESWESSTNVEEEEESSSRRQGKAEPKSWSERAEQGEETPKHVFTTPDPSPKHQAHVVMKEVEFLSWSERRMASPLVDGGLVVGGADIAGGGAEDVWKIPQDRRKLKKKTLSMEKVKGFSDDDVATVTSSASLLSAIDVNGKEVEAVIEEERRFGGGGDMTDKPDLTFEESNEYEVKGINMEVSRHSTDSRRSGRFSPSSMGDEGEEDDGNKEDKDESMECENLPDRSLMVKDCDNAGGESYRNRNGLGAGSRFEISESEDGRGLDKSTSLLVGGGVVDHTGTLSLNDDDDENENKVSSSSKFLNSRVDDNNDETIDNDGKMRKKLIEDTASHLEEDGDANNRKETAAICGVSASVIANSNSHSSRSNLDKYHTLMNVVREFLSDFFNNFREGVLTEQGVPVISEIVTFLDLYCRRSTLRIVAHCLGPDRDVATPVGRLLHLASCLKAKQIQTVLEECIVGKENGEEEEKVERQRL